MSTRAPRCARALPVAAAALLLAIAYFSGAVAAAEPQPNPPIPAGAGTEALSADPAPTSAPASDGARPYPSLEFDTKGRVTFRLYAPEAGQVLVAVEWHSIAEPMTRAPDGFWTLQLTPPPRPAHYLYCFVVDGMVLRDPMNPLGATRGMCWLPVGGEQSPSAVRAVAHGSVHIHRIHSPALNAPIRLHIYTPPGYEQSAPRRYPVLYLLDSWSATDEDWLALGSAGPILDNLIAEGKAAPMIVVAVYPGTGYSRLATGAEQPATAPSAIPATAPTVIVPADREARLAALDRSLLQDALPLVQRTYRAAPGRENRAVAGINEGGRQALSIAITEPDAFAYVASFSGAVEGCEKLLDSLSDPQSLNAGLKLLWIGCGRHDPYFAQNRALAMRLQRSGIRCVWHPTPGLRHWMLWRRYLGECVPLLFQESLSQSE